MIKVQVSNDDHFDVLDIVPDFRNGSIELVLGLVLGPMEDVVDCLWPDVGVVIAAASLVEDQALGGVIDEDDVHDEISSFMLCGSIWIGKGGRVAASEEEASICLEIAHAEDVSLCAWWATI